MVPSVKVFFEEVRAAYSETASSLGLAGPTETEHILPVSTYIGSGVKYEIALDFREGTVECGACIETESAMLTADIKDLALAAGVVELLGRISYSARDLKQLRKSLQGQAEYVQRVHPLLSGADVAEGLMRRADAREWSKNGQPGTQ